MSLMPDLEKNPPPTATVPNDSHDSDEAVSAKIWSIYIGEAEKYDKALVESWRSNMDAILIFAGLYSASLTAFIIESYKTLSPDSGDLTVQLLTRLSLQLQPQFNSTTSTPDLPSTFTAPTTALVCNTLWFISLCLSLSCALIATLVEQWSRDFIQRTEMRSSPILRARIFSYLYYGLKRFNMHLVVEAIPLLLHTSLFLFFAGLLAFLSPVNKAIMAISAATLAIMMLVYAYFTLLPLYWSDCPYRTPISGALWRLQIFVRGLVRRPDSPPEKGMVDTVFSEATRPSADRDHRDSRALSWTLRSLNDDDELEPFLEAIPDLLYDSRGRRFRYDENIRAVCRSDGNLAQRMEMFLLGCRNELLPLQLRQLRQMKCLKALWCIASICRPDRSHNQPLHSFNINILETTLPSENTMEYDTVHLIPSVTALLRWSKYCEYVGRVYEIRQNLSTSLQALHARRIPHLGAICSRLQDMRHLLDGFLPEDSLEHCILNRLMQEAPAGKDPQIIQSWIDDTSKCILFESEDFLHLIRAKYLLQVVGLTHLPKRFDDTWATLDFPSRAPSPQTSSRIAGIYERIAEMRVCRKNGLLRLLIKSWSRPEWTPDHALGRCLVHFICSQYSNTHETINYVPDGTIMDVPLDSTLIWVQIAEYVASGNHEEHDLEALHWASRTFRRVGVPGNNTQGLLNALCKLETLRSAVPTVLGCIALVRRKIIHELEVETPVTLDGIQGLHCHLENLGYIGTSVNAASRNIVPSCEELSRMLQEARITLLADFLKKCSSLIKQPCPQISL
ncbi:hypothetical protein C8R43DRAFT_639752 [Mycena crocata]|nr:hypothetical protein C8R43DRAFT_639752 [Mycena crocata]